MNLNRILVSLVLFTSTLLRASEINCTSASKTSERLICSSKTLRSLDATMQSLAHEVKRPGFEANQHNWLKRRNALTDEADLEAAYQRRIKYLTYLKEGQRDYVRKLEGEVEALGDGKPTRVYKLPSDCRTLIKDGDTLIKKSASQLEVNYYQAKISECQFHELVASGASKVQQDYLKGIDIWYLPLRELPLIDCDIAMGERSYLEKCVAYRKEQLQFHQLSDAVHFDDVKGAYVIADRSLQKSGVAKDIVGDCHLFEGEFYGVINYTEQKVQCHNRIDRAILGEGSGFAITQFAFRDFNKDGAMDVVLHINDLSSGTARVSAVVVATRLQAGKPITRVYLDDPLLSRGLKQ